MDEYGLNQPWDGIYESITNIYQGFISLIINIMDMIYFCMEMIISSIKSILDILKAICRWLKWIWLYIFPNTSKLDVLMITSCLVSIVYIANILLAEPNITNGTNQNVDQSNSIELGMKKRTLSDIVHGNQVVCFQPNTKNNYRIWSTAYFEVKSESSCLVHEKISIADFEYTQILVFLFAKLQQLQNSFNNDCHHVRYLPLFSRHCIKIEIDGELQVDYVFRSKQF